MIADKFAEKAPQRKRNIMFAIMGIAAVVAAIAYSGAGQEQLAWPLNAHCWNKKFVLTQDVVGRINAYKSFWRFTGQNNFIARAPTATNDAFMLSPSGPNAIMTRVVNGIP